MLLLNLVRGSETPHSSANVIESFAGLIKTTVHGLIKQLLSKMSNALAKGENVKISGFGSFVLRDKNERIGRNPKTGIEVPITPRRVMTFRASQLLKERIAKG